MSGPEAYDQAEFLAALERHAPAAFADLRSIAKGPAADDETEVAARLKRWNLEAPWLRYALVTWIGDIREWGSKVGRPSLAGGSLEHGQVLPLRWEPSGGENREAFHTRALRALDEYELQVMKWARSNGIARAYERKRGLPTGLDRWQPLILERVRGWPIDRVARQFGLDGPESARRAVKALARRLGFTISLRRRAADRN